MDYPDFNYNSGIQDIEPSMVEAMGLQNQDENQESSQLNAPFFNMESGQSVADFNANIAGFFPEHFLKKLGSQLRQSLKSDMDSRSEWKQKLDQGLEVLGIGPREKSETVVQLAKNFNPAYLKTWLRLCSEINAEMFPPNDIASTRILGPRSMKTEKMAEAAKVDVNYRLCEVWDDFIPEFERIFAWTFIAGKVLAKVYYDPFMGRPYLRLIKPARAVVNNAESSLDTADRISHLFTLSERQLRTYQATGAYLNLPLQASNESASDADEDDQVQERVNSFDGISERSTAQFSFEKTYELAEMQVYLNLDEFNDAYVKDSHSEIPIPYRVVFSPEDGTILALYRDWDQMDPTYTRKKHLIDFTYIPGFDFWGYGMAHIAAGAAQSATTIQRQLIDSGILSNFPGGFRAKGIRFSENRFNLEPGEFKEVETSGMELKNNLMPLPINAPSPVLKELLSDLENGIMEMGGITSLKMEDLNANMPATGVLALLEQQSKPQSAVMRRFQRSMNRFFQILQRIFVEDMPQTPVPFAPMEIQGVTFGDLYAQNVELTSSADPNMTSLAARMTRNNALLELSQQAPQLYNMREIHKRICESMKVPDLDQLLVSEEELQQMQQQQMEQQQQQIDPNQVLMQDLQIKQHNNEMKNQLEQLKLAQKAQEDKLKSQMELIELQNRTERDRMKQEVDLYRAATDYIGKKGEIYSRTGVVLPDVEEPYVGPYHAEKEVEGAQQNWHEKQAEEEMLEQQLAAQQAQTEAEQAEQQNNYLMEQAKQQQQQNSDPNLEMPGTYGSEMPPQQMGYPG